ncbi:Lrp/AsnC family transcriptional regulator [Ruegeria jejuensis]|uniref:Lrp/AsnC family transcriptional regulator n=1 Tax=Ruegeria jejuensis TaxID=3233338 RepID=UPI00355B54E7
MTTEIDDSDRIILQAIQEDRRIGLDALADRCGLSVPSVQRRLKRLKDTGVIQREVAILNPSSFDYKMTFIVLVELERESLQQLDLFRKRVRAEPQVQQCYYVTGDADFILVCTAQDMQDFEALTHRLFFENSNVRRFRTSVAMERTKVGLSIPV